jgi:hypothetical protein
VPDTAMPAAQPTVTTALALPIGLLILSIATVAYVYGRRR